MLQLEMNLPCFEMSQFPKLRKFDQIYTVSCLSESINVCSAVDNSVYLSFYDKRHWKNFLVKLQTLEWMVEIGKRRCNFHTQKKMNSR
jgi:hypothetical protein